MARLFLILFVLCLCLTACGDMSPTPNPTVQPAAQPTPTTTQPTPTSQSTLTPTVNVTPGNPQDEDNIREAILRYRFGQVFGSSAYPSTYYYCLGFETTPRSASNLTDLPQTFLDRFKGNNPPVLKASDCIFSEDRVKVKSSGEPAMFWGLGKINWSGNNRADLEISLLYAFNGTEGTIFQLERQNGTWKVTGYTMTWIA